VPLTDAVVADPGVPQFRILSLEKPRRVDRMDAEQAQRDGTSDGGRQRKGYEGESARNNRRPEHLHERQRQVPLAEVLGTNLPAIDTLACRLLSELKRVEVVLHVGLLGGRGGKGRQHDGSGRQS
jgi:hypothetical protein